MRTLGAPSGALMTGILSGVESLYVRPITPLNGGSGCGRTSCPSAVDPRSNDNVETPVNRATCDMNFPPRLRLLAWATLGPHAVTAASFNSFSCDEGESSNL